MDCINAQNRKFTGLHITKIGTKIWYLKGIFHREDGPAIEWADGSKAWYLKGERHREGGPAIERANGSKAWYLNGERLTEQDWKIEMRKIKIGKLLEC